MQAVHLTPIKVVDSKIVQWELLWSTNHVGHFYNNWNTVDRSNITDGGMYLKNKKMIICFAIKPDSGGGVWYLPK